MAKFGFAAAFAAAFSIWLFYTGWKLKRDLHMMQQNSYRNDRYFRWLKGNLGRSLKIRDLLPLLSLVPVILGSQLLSAVTFLFIYLLLLAWRGEVKEKKKLVMTSRAKRLYVVSLLIIFLAAGLGFWLVVSEAGSTAGTVFVLVKLVGINVCSFLVMLLANFLITPVENTINNGYYRDARKIVREMPNLTVIGLTGSFGKTSTKLILTKVLSDKFNVLTTPGSYNTPMGLTKVIRTMLKPIHEVFVAEMGAKQKGDIKELCDLVAPRYGILTAVGEQHLETFKTLENIKNTKFELIESLPPDGTAFFNMDDENVRSLAPRSKVRSITYGIESKDVDFSAGDIRLNARGTAFTVRERNGGQAEFQTKLLGRHNVYNILAAAAVASELGMRLDDAARAVRDLEPLPHRLALKRTPQNVAIIDDAFNSNPVGSRMALEVLGGIPGERKIIITPGMVELGEKQYEINKAFAVEAAKVCDYIILVGKKHTKPLQDGLKSVDFPGDHYYVAADLNDANRRMQSIVRPGDVVLFENDLPDTYNE